MTVYEALSILEISGSYDENELKIVYRKFAKKYHPDNFKDDKERIKAEEKLKQINIAYETLLNNRDRNANFNYTYHNYYQENRTVFFKQKMAKKALKKYQAKRYEITLSKWVSYINYIILDFYAKTYNTVDEVNYNYQEALRRIVNLYKELQREFFEKHIINESVISETINYNCSLDDFYEQLLKIKDKYSIEEVFLRKIEETTKKYKYYAGYDIAKVEIEAQKRKKYNEKVEVLQKNIDIFTIEGLYKFMQVFLKELEDEIEEIFSKAFDIKNTIDNLKDRVEKTDDDEIVEEYINLKTNFNDGQLFSKTNDEINMIEEMITIKDHIGELRNAVQQDYIKQFISEKDVHMKIMITSTYNEVFDYIKSLKRLSRIEGIASMLEDKDYVRVIILIKLYVMKDVLEKIKQNNDSDYKKRI